MADEAEAKSGRSRFLSKSKWGKVFKENETPPPAGKVNSFKLNDDVVDFLKPSTEKGTRPKINIAVAQRWPEAHEVRRASEANTDSQQQTGYRKPRRRPGLTVGFVKTAPDIIGEGGDDAEDPPNEMSRKRYMMARSVSDRRPGSLDEGRPWPGTQASRAPPMRQARPPSGPEEDFRPQPVRRVQTSHYEASPPVQRKIVAPPLEQPPPHKPSLGRTPTGYDGLVNFQVPTPMRDDDQQHPQAPPSIQTRFEQGKPEPDLRNFSPMANAPVSPAVRKRRDMEGNEGMALRRASALYMNDENEDSVRQDLSAGVLPSPKFYNHLSDPAASSALQDAPQHDSNLSPDSVLSPGGPSPFADPNYIKRRSGESVPVAQQPQQLPVQSLRQPRAGIQQVPAQSVVAPQDRALQPRSEAAVPQSRTTEQPSYMRTAQQQSPEQKPVQQGARQSRAVEQPSYMRAMQPPNGATAPGRPPPAPSQTMSVPQDSSRDRSRSPMRDRIFDDHKAPEKPRPLYSQPNHSSGSINHFSPSPRLGHSRNSSRDETSPQFRVSESSVPPATSAQRFQGQRESPQSVSPRSSYLGPSGAGKPAVFPYARGPSPADYFSAPKAAQSRPVRSPAVHNLQQEEDARPSSSGSTRSAYRPAPSPLPPAQGDPAADLALADFAERVAHMKGVFRLTAEKERPSDTCTPQAWLRTALWWYLRGKAGLEIMLQQRAKNSGDRRELLLQPHVDLSKAWWILSDVLEMYDTLDNASPQSVQPGGGPEQVLQQSVALLRSHLRSLSASMQRSQLMPPHQSLIQGQDTRIWLEYPRFASDAAAVLNGSASKSLIIDNLTPAASPLDALPIGETRDAFCYGRFTVNVSLNTDDAETDRVTLACTLSMLRGKRDYQSSIIIASQNELVNVRLGPQQDKKGLTWQDVSWKASSQAMVIRLPRGFDMTVRMQERDYRSLWNLVEYSRKVEHSLSPEAGEDLVHEVRLAELQYADSSGANAFPSEKIRGCSALVFERTIEHRDSSGTRKAHRGYRLLLVTDPGHKSLSSVSHELGRRSPLMFEFMTDAAANGTTAMVIRVREDSRQCRILLVFTDNASRQSLYDVLTGITVGPDEVIVGKMNVTGVNIQAATQTEGYSPISHPALQALQWQKLGVNNHRSDDPNTRIAETVESESLRILARHTAGCITDRLNLSKGELLLRVPCADTRIPSIQVLRNPQEDLAMSLDTRQAPQHVTNDVSELLLLAQQQSTIRTFSFATSTDLHAFQAAITGFTVRYDGVASTFGISRRMMVVPIHHKLQASSVRLQVVTQSSITQVMAFMEDFVHADAMCFQVKSTDTFETVKGDSKGRKWAIKMKDAKFSLPRQPEKGDVAPEEKVKRRFVNLEGLDYAEEHDDITIGFDTEEERDRFAQALPAAATVGRMITLKRRI